MSQVIDFYSGRDTDHRGRTLDEILAWDDQRLEHTHDYIQWLFPLAEPSRFNPHAPLLTDADRAEFERRPELRAKMLGAFRRMLEFYGFAIEHARSDGEGRLPITGLDQSRHWLSSGNHNYLRITRILTSLRLVGLATWADAFFEALAQLYRDQPAAIGAETFGYWERAIT